MTDPETADAVYIEPINWQTVEKIIAKERPDALLPTMGGQTALNCALDLADHGVLEKYGVELIGASRDAIRMAEDRELFRHAMMEIGLDCPKAEVARIVRAGARYPDQGRLSDHHPAELHARRLRRRHRLQPRGIRGDRQARPRALAGARSADRGIGARLEGIRDGSRARQGGQLHHRLLDRELRSDGRAHRRLDHGRAGADADRQGIPAPARRVDRGAAQDRRRHRRLERAVRRQFRERPRRRHRDESARVAFVGAGLEGDRLSDREGRRQARSRLHARRAAQRDHRRQDAGVVRADDRLRRHQDSALRVREIPVDRFAPDDADEIGRRSHGDRPHVPGIAAEGAARSGDRQERS